jgi:hypothetical protein
MSYCCTSISFYFAIIPSLHYLLRLEVKHLADKKVGSVTHYYTNLGVGIITLSSALKVGATVRFAGATTDFEQEITSMQFDHKEQEKAKKGQEIGVKVSEQVREGDEVFLVS